MQGPPDSSSFRPSPGGLSSRRGALAEKRGDVGSAGRCWPSAGGPSSRRGALPGKRRDVGPSGRCSAGSELGRIRSCPPAGSGPRSPRDKEQPHRDAGERGTRGREAGATGGEQLNSGSPPWWRRSGGERVPAPIASVARTVSRVAFGSISCPPVRNPASRIAAGAGSAPGAVRSHHNLHPAAGQAASLPKGARSAGEAAIPRPAGTA